MTVSATTKAWTLAAELPQVRLSIELFPPKWPADAMALLQEIGRTVAGAL